MLVFSEILIHYRKLKKLTQREAAEQEGFPMTTWTSWEYDRCPHCSAEALFLAVKMVDYMREHDPEWIKTRLQPPAES